MPDFFGRDRVLWMVLGAFVVSLILGLTSVYVVYLYLPLGHGENMLVTIAPGSPVVVIGRKLQSEGIIRSGAAFTLFVRLRGQAAKLQAGTYDLSPSLSLGEVVETIIKGDVIDSSIRVTIPEGLTLPGIGLLFEKRGLFTQNEFLQALQEVELPFAYLERIPTGVHNRLEGYLFPDTYQFPPDVHPKQVVRIMAARFNEIVPPMFASSPLSQRYTLHQLVTMASIVEKEAVKQAERPVIAGVFFNRLRRNMRLESCATIQFLLGTPRPLLYADLEIVSPYNTYRHLGLPPGPIANPGLASIAAALNPAETRYLFFVAQSDRSHIFSITYEQHLAAIRQARR